MKNLLLLSCLVISFSACKKSADTIENGTEILPTTKCNGRYDKDLFTAVNTGSEIKFGRGINISGAMQDLYLNIYEPGGDALQKRPLILFVHGGAWTSGNKLQGTDPCIFFAKKGYVAATIDYRLGIENPVNDVTRGEAVLRVVQDIKAAVRFAKANAALYKIDTTQVFIGGYSAGAASAMHAAYWDQNEVPAFINQSTWGNLEGNGGNPSHSSETHAVYGIASSIGDLNWMQAGEQPVVCVHSKTDMTEPYGNAPDGQNIFVYGGSSIVQRAAALQLPSSLYTYESIAHGDYLIPQNFNTTMNAVSSFFYGLVRCD